MNERDLRSAFNQLKEDVLMNVQTEERLEQVTTPQVARRRPVVAAAAVVAGAAAVALIVGGVVVALRPGASDPVPPATGGPSTTIVDTTAPATTEVATTLLPVAAPGTVLIADGNVPVLEEGDGYLAYLADRVVSDGGEGIVIQVDQRLTRIEPSGESQELVRAEDIAADQGPVTIRLEDLARIDGVPHVLFTVTGGTFEEPFQQVWVYDLSSRASYPIYGRSEFESNIVRASLANNTLLLTIAEEGTTYFEIVDGAGQPIKVDAPLQAGSGTDFSSPLAQGVLSPDGSTLVYVQIQDVTTGEDGFYFADLIVWDLVGGVELERLEIEFRNESGALPSPERLDYDGEHVVVGRVQNLVDGPVALRPLLVGSLAAGTYVEVGIAGTPSLVK